MSRPLLPPRGIFTGTRWLYDPQLSPNIKETLLQLMALTWGSEGRTTPPLSYAQLEAITHKDARTLRGHFSALRTYYAALRLQPTGAGQFIIALAGWLFRNDEDPAVEAQPGNGPAGKFLPSGKTLPFGKTLPPPVKDDQNQEEDSFLPTEENHLPDLPPDHDQVAAKSAQNGRAAGQRARRASAAGSLDRPARPAPSEVRQARAGRALSGPFEARLRAVGVFPVLLAEISARAAQDGYSEVDLGALLDWCQEEQPERAAQLFIGRLRAGARAPAAYLTPACPRCGLRGRHGPECPRRYAMDGC